MAGRKPPQGYKKAMEYAQEYRKKHPSAEWRVCLKKGWQKVKERSGSKKGSKRGGSKKGSRRSSRK